MPNAKMLVTFNHISKTATMAMISEDNEILIDYKGQPLENMTFPYENLKLYPLLFEKISDDGRIGKYYFPVDPK